MTATERRARNTAALWVLRATLGPSVFERDWYNAGWRLTFGYRAFYGATPEEALLKANAYYERRRLAKHLSEQRRGVF